MDKFLRRVSKAGRSVVPDKLSKFQLPERTLVPRKTVISTRMKQLQLKKKTPQIYHREQRYGFGDHWGAVNWLLMQSELQNQKMLFSCGGWSKHVRTMIDCIESTGDVEAIESGRGIALPKVEQLYHLKYLPTKKRWSYKHIDNVVCYQLKGHWKGSLKNPPNRDIRIILDHINSLGYEAIKMGKPLTIPECINLACASKCLVCVDSGMAHLCRSIGIPIFMIKYRYTLDRGHPRNTYTLCNGTTDCLNKLTLFLYG